ncbi:MAG: trypsin-like peptidase domain-containing protein [Candidatus Acidiferrum sp.]
MKTVGIAFLLFCTSFVFASPQNKTESSYDKTPEIVKNSVDAVVLIVTSDASGTEIGQGSGFIISVDGKIITNYHVIKGVKSAVIKLSNGAFFPMETVLGSDPNRDLAVIKVAGRNLPTLSLADSGKAAVGEHVIAIGSPLGLQNTVSEGIISAFRTQDAKVDWIQTTTPVSPGNSGGPLIRADGSVVGVITWGVKIGQNLNFAAPSNEVLELLSRPSAAEPSRPAANESSAPPTNVDQIWTSITSGRDYKVRFSGDYIYTEWVNLPPELSGTAAFARGELKNGGQIWTGYVKSQIPCKYQNSKTKQWQMNWLDLAGSIEITGVTATRIEGRSQAYPGGFNCETGSPKGSPEWSSFTWIPKD